MADLQGKYIVVLKARMPSEMAGLIERHWGRAINAPALSQLPRWGRQLLWVAAVALGYRQSEATVGRMLVVINKRCPICWGANGQHAIATHLLKHDLRRFDRLTRRRLPPLNCCSDVLVNWFLSSISRHREDVDHYLGNGKLEDGEGLEFSGESKLIRQVKT